MTISVEDRKDELNYREWSFYLFGLNLVLNGVRDYSKLSRRHKYRVIAEYNRLDRRATNMAKPTAPQEIQEKIMRQLLSEVKFTETPYGP